MVPEMMIPQRALGNMKDILWQESELLCLLSASLCSLNSGLEIDFEGLPPLSLF